MLLQPCIIHQWKALLLRPGLPYVFSTNKRYDALFVIMLVFPGIVSKILLIAHKGSVSAAPVIAERWLERLVHHCTRPSLSGTVDPFLPFHNLRRTRIHI